MSTVSTAPGSEIGRSEIAWVRVCPIEDITPDRGVAALVGHEQVAIFLLTPLVADPQPENGSGDVETPPDAPDSEGGTPGEIYAIDNRDPYSGANVMARGLVGSAGDHPTVASPIYKQRFDLRDGTCLDGDKVVRAWPVRIREEWVEVGTEAV